MVIDQVEDATDQRQNFCIQIVRHKDHRGSSPLALGQQITHRVLTIGIERDERLVTQEQERIAHQELGNTEALLLATREQANRCICVLGCSDAANRLVDPLISAGTISGPAVVRASQPELDNVSPTDIEVGVKGFLLGQVADLVLGSMGRLPKELDRSGLNWNQSEQGLQQCGFTSPVWPEDGDELTWQNPKTEITPDGSCSMTKRGATKFGERFEVGC